MSDYGEVGFAYQLVNQQRRRLVALYVLFDRRQRDLGENEGRAAQMRLRSRSERHSCKARQARDEPSFLIRDALSQPLGPLALYEVVVDAFVKLSGRAAILEDRLELSRRWKSAYDRFFPAEADRENATFVDASINRMDLWIRGVTPEPFGLQTTRLARDEDGQWRVAGNVVQACQ